MAKTKIIVFRDCKIQVRSLFSICNLFIDPSRAEPGYTLPEEANWSGSALFAIKYVNNLDQVLFAIKYVNKLDQVIWLAEN